jgi:hypothetical protein
MNKAELIELVKENLSGGDAPAEIRGKYHPKIIEKYLEMAYDDLVATIYQESEPSGNFAALDTFGKAYKVILKKDEDRGELYVELDISVVPLPNNKGITLVCPYRDQTSAFDYVDNNSSHVFRKLHNQVMRPVGTYYAELPRIYIANVDPTLIGKDIMVKAIPPFNGLKSTDDVFVPAGKNTMLFNLVYELMVRKNQTPKDDYDNNNSKQI